MKRRIAVFFVGVVCATISGFSSNTTVGTYLSLLSAINNTFDTIYINGSITVDATVEVDRNVVLIGTNNGTLDGASSCRIMKILYDSVSIKNLTFRNGRSYVYDSFGAGGGGAIATVAKVLEIDNCRFEGNQSPAQKNGGAITGSGTRILISNSTFSQNSSGSFGGAIYLTPLFYVEINKCVFSNNNTSEAGGAIWIQGASDGKRGTVVVLNSIFDSNTAGRATGALDLHNWQRAVIFNSSFTNNSSGTLDPGAICVGEVGRIDIINSTIAKNHSDGDVGGIGLFRSENVNIYNCIMVGNTARIGVRSISDIANTSGNFLTSTVDIYNSTYQSIALTPTIASNNIVGVVPTAIFADFANNNFSLSANSIAVNGGDSNLYIREWNRAFTTNQITSISPHLDVQNSNRLQKCNIDMGAYESPHGDRLYTIIDTFFYCQTYKFLNKTYNKAGVFVDTIKIGNNCDSIITLNLTQIQKPPTLLSDTICENDTLFFGGRGLTQSGVYIDTIAISPGCDSIVELKLTKAISSHHEYADTIYECEKYPFGKNTLTSSGVYFDTIRNRLGCDSIIKLNLTVEPDSINQSLSICANNLPVTLYDTTFNHNTTSGTYAFLHKCARIVLNLNILPAVQVEKPIIPRICSTDSEFEIKIPRVNVLNSKYPTNFSVEFGTNAQSQGFQNFSGAFASDSSVRISVPNSTYPDRYSIKLVFEDSVSKCYALSLDTIFEVYYPDSIMQQKWGDVVGLRTKHYNGGFEIASHQWYLNGVPLQGETGAYLQNTIKIGDEVSVMIKRPDGSQIMSCPLIIGNTRPEIYINPTIMQPNSTIHISTKNGDIKYVSIIEISGIVVKKVAVNPSMSPQATINAPNKEGLYLIEIVDSGGSKQTSYIVVKS